jgi:hypothetical protein
MTPTAKMTPTITPTPTVTVKPDPTDCTGANPHPHASTLALQYKVPYTEIMGWKCSGFGSGEIEQAYTLSRETETVISVIEMFEKRRDGLGWGQIKKQLLDGYSQEDGRPGGNPNKNPHANPHGKKDKGDKDNAGHGQGRSGQAVNGPANKDKGDKGQGNKGGGKKDK